MRRVLLALCVALGAGCSDDPPLAVVVSARELGFLDQSPAIQGRDGGESARVWGRTVFAFGDTVLDVPDAEGQTWHHNSFSFTDDTDASDGIGPLVERNDAAGAPIYFVAPTADEAAFNVAHRGDPCMEMPCGARWAAWPGEPVWDAARGRALVFYELIYAEPGDFNFRGVGQSLAVWTSFDDVPARPELSPGSAHPTLLWAEGERAPGIAPQVVGEDLFAFECRKASLSRPCVLFSAPLSRALEHDAWRVWTGDGWSASPSDGEDLFDGAPIMSVHWNTWLGAYVAVYSRPLGNDVVMRTAPALTGPWSDEGLLFVANRGTASGWTYDAVAHAELSGDGGRILYVTYSQPTGVTWFSGRFPLVEVVLARR